jgi:DNA helicase-2/ATP-dependent DNA helicase PcrA
VVKLVRDYRSTPQVVGLANGLLSQARGQAAAHRLELISQREAGPEPTYAEYADEPAEAEGAARRIKELIGSGVRPSEIAVLYRINAQSEVYEQALADAGVPYQLRGAERFFERPEVREAGLLLRGAARASADPEDAATVPEQVRAVLSSRGWASEPPAGSGAVRDRWESLAALVRLSEDFTAAKPDAILGDFVAELDERANAQHAPTVEGVTLASLHAAKGLEWDAVLIVGLVEGTMPITYAATPAAVEEERRLLYVGVTRAREHLHLSWALARSPGGRASRQPSRFLDGLRPAGSGGAAVRVRSAGGSGRRGRRAPLPTVCAGCGRALTAAADRTRGRCADCPPAYDEAVFERLRAWRLERAQRDSVPAYVVFTDATLEAVAARGPTTLGELATINGVGTVKLERYGPDVLALLHPGEPASR